MRKLSAVVELELPLGRLRGQVWSGRGKGCPRVVEWPRAQEQAVLSKPERWILVNASADAAEQWGGGEAGRLRGGAL